MTAPGALFLAPPQHGTPASGAETATTTSALAWGPGDDVLDGDRRRKRPERAGRPGRLSVRRHRLELRVGAAVQVAGATKLTAMPRALPGRAPGIVGPQDQASS